jgi:predicted transposase/invertase (TIGR01784 family)
LAFKKILCSQGHEAVPQGFIADFFGIEAELGQIRIENPYSIQPRDLGAGEDELAKLRQTFRDVTLAVDAALDLVVELQLHLTRFFEARSLYYLFDRFNSRYDRAAAELKGAADWRYSSLRAVYGLNIVAEELGGSPAALRMYRLYDPALGEAMVPDLLRVGYWDLTKSAGLTGRQAAWREFLLTGVAPQGAPAYLREASKMIEYVNLRTEEREMADVLEKARATAEAELAHARHSGAEQGLAQGLAQGRAEGRTQGRAEGRAEGRLEGARAVAARLLAMGMAPAAVAEATGLDPRQLADPGAAA